MTRPAEMLSLDLALPADDVAALRRRLGGMLGRARRCMLAWHDDPAGTLLREGVAVHAWRDGRHSGWRAEALNPDLPPGGLPLILAEGTALAALPGVRLPETLVPVQRLEGQLREGLAADVALCLLEGRLEDGSRLARLRLAGPPAEVAELALALAGQIRLGIPGRGLAAEALAQAGRPVPHRRLGAPQLPPGLAPGAAFAAAAGHLLGVLLHHAPAAAAGRVGEPVHQMRVALRRLRALAAVFGDVVICPEVDEMRPALKALASALGPAREWDVFLDTTGPRVKAAFPAEPGLAALLAGAEAQRAAAYAGLAEMLAGPTLRNLAIRIAVVIHAVPWERLSSAPAGQTVTFGAAVLARRWRQVTRRAGNFGEAPEPALHDMRLKAKRLRYAAEVFAPLFPGRGAPRFLKRLAALQESLGHLNDGATANALMRALPDQGGAGLAGGLVRGFVAGRAGGARADIARGWKRLRKAGRFWE